MQLLTGDAQAAHAGDIWSTVPKSIRLDEDTIGYFKSLAEKNGIPYQNLINLYLRECAESGKTLAMKWS